MHEAKQRAARITEVSELWELEEWLGKRRRQINNTFDYRYSVLPNVFAELILKKRLALEDLRGIAPEKLKYIERFVRLMDREKVV